MFKRIHYDVRQWRMVSYPHSAVNCSLDKTATATMVTVINHNVCHCQSDCQRAQVLTISDCHPLRSKMSSLNVQKDQKNVWKGLFELLKSVEVAKGNFFVCSTVVLSGLTPLLSLNAIYMQLARQVRTLSRESSGLALKCPLEVSRSILQHSVKRFWATNSPTWVFKKI